jgi:5'-nucleotidase
MRILLTNDDGIHAPGLEVLETIARELSDDIWICAPADEQSGAGHSLTLTRPVRLRKLGERRFAITGTPTDAVTLALRKVLPGPPDLVLSGVNRGENLGDDMTYSGTVSAAMEGALAGIRSVALSQSTLRPEYRFSAALGWGARVLRPLIEAPHSERTLVNINFPALPAEEVKGVRVVRQGFHAYERGSVVEGTDPRGMRYFWFGLEDIERTTGHETDLEAVADGYIAVTPLQLDLTHYPSLGLIGELYA